MELILQNNILFNFRGLLLICCGAILFLFLYNRFYIKNINKKLENKRVIKLPEFRHILFLTIVIVLIIAILSSGFNMRKDKITESFVFEDESKRIVDEVGNGTNDESSVHFNELDFSNIVNLYAQSSELLLDDLRLDGFKCDIDLDGNIMSLSMYLIGIDSNNPNDYYWYNISSTEKGFNIVVNKSDTVPLQYENLMSVNYFVNKLNNVEFEDLYKDVDAEFTSFSYFMSKGKIIADENAFEILSDGSVKQITEETVGHKLTYFMMDIVDGDEDSTSAESYSEVKYLIHKED